MNFLKTAIDKNKGTLNYSFDLEWMNKKIDVKSCNLYKRKKKRGKPVKKEQSGWWIFNKNKGFADFYFCICLVENIPLRYYLIPKEEFKNGISIGQRSSFDKYLVKYYGNERSSPNVQERNPNLRFPPEIAIGAN